MIRIQITSLPKNSPCDISACVVQTSNLNNDVFYVDDLFFCLLVDFCLKMLNIFDILFSFFLSCRLTTMSDKNKSCGENNIGQGDHKDKLLRGFGGTMVDL